MIYISLTTVPRRMDFEYSSRKNIESLLNQKTDKEFKVLYNVPHFYAEQNIEYKIPDWIYEIAKQNDKFIINRIKDYGPVTKILGALLYTTNSDDVLIICDDDQLYHEEMLEYHLKKQEQYKNCAIAFRGDRLCEKREWIDEGIKKYVYVSIPDYFPTMRDVNIAITGHWHSVSYLRSMFKEDFLDENFLNMHWSDDIIVGYYMVKNNIEIKCVSWDKETDFRLVNTCGRNSNSFPVLENLPFESDTGCFVLRNKTGVYIHEPATYPEEWVRTILSHYDGSEKVVE
jgi:hypothetical protein